MKKLIEKYENNILAIGEVFQEEYLIKSFSGEWMDFSASEKVSLFKETVEKDQKFSEVVSFMRGKEELNVGEVVQDLIESVKSLSVIERFVAYVYVQLSCELYTIDTKRPFVETPERIRVYLGPRVSNMNQNKTYSFIANNFGLGMTSWDGETAVSDPLRDGESCWNVNYELISQCYLLKKGVDCKNLIDEQDKVKNTLIKLLEIDRKLIQLKKKTGFEDKALRQYLNVENLYKDFPRINEAVDVLSGYTFREDGIYVKVGQNSSVKGDRLIYHPSNSEHINTPEEAWCYGMCNINQAEIGARPTKKYSSEISIVKDGIFLGSVILPSYFIYEDFVGGRSIWEKHFKVEEIIDVNVKEDDIVISYIDGDGERREVKVEK